MKVKIRPIIETEFPILLDLFKEFAEFQNSAEKMKNTLEQMTRDKDLFKCFVAANENNEIIGYAVCFFAYFTWTGKCLYMDDLYVKPGFRKQGIGKILINSVTEFAKKENCLMLRWQVSEWNTNAIEFYRKLGARIDPDERNCTLTF